MKVSELIEKLKQCDQDADVFVLLEFLAESRPTETGELDHVYQMDRSKNVGGHVVFLEGKET